MTGLLSHFTKYLPEIIIGFIITAVIVMILIAFFTSRAVRSAKKAKAPVKPLPEKAKEEPKPVAEEKMPPIGGWFSEALTLKGYFRVSDISLSFLRAIEFLNNRLEGQTPKYDLPWYLMIGASGSGKTTLLQGADLSLPVGTPDFGILDPNPPVRWWFFNRAIVLDIKGFFTIAERGTGSDEKGWRTVISLLGRYRAKRPIDGLILTIPATELYGKSKLPEEEIHDRARFMASKILAAQNLLGLRLPVYIVVTKSDIIPGFKNFCSEIPAANRDNMMGWSCPYTLQTAFSPHWIDEAFGYIKEELYRLRLELLAESTRDESRDGIFVFPTELMEVKKPLSQYLVQLFRHSTYEDSLMLRGIYFTGDTGEVALPVGMQLRQDLDDGLSLTTDPRFRDEALFHEDRPLRSITFAHDLLDDKVFREIGIAYPIHSRLKSANRNLNLAKIGLIAFIGIGTFGLMNAYDTFSRNRDYLSPVLMRVNTMLAQVHANQNVTGRNAFVDFDDQVKKLIDMMSHMQRATFFSIFVPQSWFSPLQRNINSSLKISYENIILRAIYMDLLMKARDILNTRPSPTDKTTSMGLLLEPTTMPEYQLFKSYIEQVDLLLQNVNKFNKLQDSPDPDLLRELIEYTINIPLPKEFETYYKQFRKVLQDVPYPQIELTPYQGLAQETLMVLYNNFLSSLFSPQDPLSLIGQIRFVLNNYGEVKTEEVPDLETLRKFANDIATSVPKLGAPGTNWIDAPHFDPAGGFADLIAKISDMTIFGKDVVSRRAQQTNMVFGRFKDELNRMNTMLVNTPLIPTGEKIYPSQGLIALQKALNVLLREPFMQQTDATATFPDAVPEGQIISWNSKLVDAASDLAKRYDEFLLKNMDQFPLNVRETMKLIAQRNLQQSIINYISKAQSIISKPTKGINEDTAGEILRTQINDIKEVLPKIAKLMEILNRGDAGKVFINLRSLMGSMVLGYLEQVEAVLQKYTPYDVKDSAFKDWDGQSDIFLSAYNVKDDADLMTHLGLQRQRIEHLAKNFAKPLIQFLTSDIMEGFEGDRTLVNRWKRILDQIDLYEKKKPENSITVLESFITKEASDLTLTNCFTKIPLSEVQGSSGDFFLDQRLKLRRGVLARCEVQKRQKSIDAYNEMAEFFNANIKNKYPFTRQPYSQSSGEAEPEDLKKFFDMLKAAGDSAKVVLDQVYQLGASAKESYNFLLTMEKVRDFMKNFLKTSAPNIQPAFDFEIDFRINRESEVNANQIIDLTFSPNEQTILNNNSKLKTGRWSFGDPVTFTFRWPDSSEVSPYPEDSQSNLKVDQQLATYTFTGRWSILLAIQLQRAKSSDFGNMNDPTPYTLKFEVPNGPTERTVVFDRLTLMEPPKGKTPGKALTIPDFPTDAPTLPEEVTNFSDKPVLTQGKIKAYEPEEETPAEEGATPAAEAPASPEAAPAAEALAAPESEAASTPAAAPAAGG